MTDPGLQRGTDAGQAAARRRVVDPGFRGLWHAPDSRKRPPGSGDHAGRPPATDARGGTPSQLSGLAQYACAGTVGAGTQTVPPTCFAVSGYISRLTGGWRVLLCRVHGMKRPWEGCCRNVAFSRVWEAVSHGIPDTALLDVAQQSHGATEPHWLSQGALFCGTF
jgi:hypothetical protein